MCVRLWANVSVMTWWNYATQVWPVAAGVLIAGLAGGVGWLVLRRGRATTTAMPPAPTAAAPPAAAVHDPFVDGSASEQRKACRREGISIEVYLATSDAGKECPIRARVLDRSVGGLCLDAAAPFPPGTRLAVLPANAPHTTPWTDLDVRTCRPSKGGYELGCQFLKTPPWAILILFG